MTVKIPVRLGRSKYRAVPTIVDGIRFASKKEANRYGELKLLERAGKIDFLRIQPSFAIVVEEKKICTYRADFDYWDVRLQQQIVEDVKGVRTPVYRLKKKLVEVLHAVTIQEV